MRISDWSSDVCSSDLDFACGPRTHVAMMRESGGLHRNVVRTNLALQLWQNQVDGFSTQAGVTINQACIGNDFGSIFIAASFLLQPSDQYGFVLFRQQSIDDIVLPLERKRKPIGAKMMFSLKRHIRGIA